MFPSHVGKAHPPVALLFYVSERYASRLVLGAVWVMIAIAHGRPVTYLGRRTVESGSSRGSCSVSRAIFGGLFATRLAASQTSGNLAGDVRRKSGSDSA